MDYRAHLLLILVTAMWAVCGAFIDEKEMRGKFQPSSSSSGLCHKTISSSGASRFVCFVCLHVVTWHYALEIMEIGHKLFYGIFVDLLNGGRLWALRLLSIQFCVRLLSLSQIVFLPNKNLFFILTATGKFPRLRFELRRFYTSKFKQLFANQLREHFIFTKTGSQF